LFVNQRNRNIYLGCIYYLRFSILIIVLRTLCILNEPVGNKNLGAVTGCFSSIAHRSCPRLRVFLAVFFNSMAAFSCAFAVLAGSFTLSLPKMRVPPQELSYALVKEFKEKN